VNYEAGDVGVRFLGEGGGFAGKVNDEKRQKVERGSGCLTVVSVPLLRVKGLRQRKMKKERHDAEDSSRVKTMCLINNNIRINSNSNSNSNSNNSGFVYCCARV